MELNKNTLKKFMVGFERVTRESLVDFFQLSDRRIRDDIHELRKQGCPIAQHPNGGYAWDRELFKKTQADLRKRALSMLSLLSKYERRKFNKQYELLFREAK